MKRDFQWYLDHTQGDINTLGLASGFQELLTRMEVELQNLQDALINQDLDEAMMVLAREHNVANLMGMKIEHLSGLIAEPEGEDAPVIQCPYCGRELQTIEDPERAWILPVHGTGNPADPDYIACPNSAKGPAEFLIRE